jgi:protein disulfide-isomerase
MTCHPLKTAALVIILALAWSSAATAEEVKTDAPPMPESYPVAMDGYCPVTIQVARKWVKGDPRFGAIHRRRTFLFASAEEQETFLREPDRYTPVLTGYDPLRFLKTGQLVDGSRISV